jgi:hypothetical protein
MSDARRAARRARLPGIQVIYESATGERHQATVVDLSRAGLYISSANPLPIGKRLSLEIQPIGEPRAWSALGRVVWVRDADDGDERPAGMAVKIVDAEDDVVAAIDRLLEAREPTQRGLGSGDTILPLRPRAPSNPSAGEKTMLGVAPDATAVPAAPIAIAAPGRDPMLAGVGATDASGDRPEVSVGIDMVGPKMRRGREPSSVAPRAKRHPSFGLLLLTLVIAGGFAGYTFRARLWAFSRAAASAISK